MRGRKRWRRPGIVPVRLPGAPPEANRGIRSIPGGAEASGTQGVQASGDPQLELQAPALTQYPCTPHFFPPSWPAHWHEHLKTNARLATYAW
jgi:hypothetical protein